MIERERLERELRELAMQVDWPATPDVAGALAGRLPPHATRRGRTGLGRLAGLPRSPLAVAAAALLALLIAVALVPPARSAVLRVLGLTGSTKIVRVPGPAPPSVSRSRLDLGRALPLAQAQRRAAFPIAVPTLLGPPRQVRYSSAIAGGAVSLYWQGSVLTELQGASTPFIQKLVGPRTRVRPVDVSGATGYFLSGAEHVVIVTDRNRRVVLGTPVLVRSNVLLWDRRGVAFRLETRRGLAAALALARSVP